MDQFGQMDQGQKKKLMIPLAIAAVLFCVLLFLLWGMPQQTTPYDPNVPVPIEGIGITVMLPSGAKEEKTDESVFYCAWQEGVFVAAQETDDILAQAGYDGPTLDAHDYAQMCADRAYAQTSQVSQDEYGNVYFTYELNSNGTALFYYVTVKRGASSYWACNFVCPQAQKQENLERFGLWASKIGVE